MRFYRPTLSTSSYVKEYFIVFACMHLGGHSRCGPCSIFTWSKCLFLVMHPLSSRFLAHLFIFLDGANSFGENEG
jgi:hypothetical protein